MSYYKSYVIHYITDIMRHTLDEEGMSMTERPERVVTQTYGRACMSRISSQFNGVRSHGGGVVRDRETGF